MCKARVYETDNVSSFMGLMLWSRRTDNKPRNKYTSYLQIGGMKQEGRIERERAREVRVSCLTWPRKVFLRR